MNTVAEHIHLRRWRMPPPHGNLDRTQAVVPRQVEQFRIEAEPLDALLLEKDLASFPAENLKATLCIHNRQAQDHPDNEVKDDSRELAEA